MPEQGLLLIEAVAAGGDGDPWLVLYDDLGRKIAHNDDGSYDLNSLITARLIAGTYLIGVKRLGEG